MGKETKMKYLTLALFGILKLFYINATNSSLLIILRPINKIICLFTNTIAIYTPETGYLNKSLNIIINKSCSGFNFMLLLFAIISFKLLKLFKTTLQGTAAISLFLAISYLVTIFVNTSRILLSLKTRHLFTELNITLPQLHLIEGIFVYLFFLTSIYLILDKIIYKRMLKHEQIS